MCKNIKLYFTLLVFSYTLSLVGQPTFTNQTNKYKSNFPTRSTYTGAILDMDSDLVDDLVIIDKGIVVKWYKSTGKFFGFELVDTLVLPGVRKSSITAGDLDNDGANELIISGNKDNIQVVKIINGKLSLTTINAKFYAQASNTADINNDGWLDYFSCDDDSFNKLYLNDASGKLSLSNYIDFVQGDTSDGSGNYGGAWVDINGDMKADLAVAKCRAGVNDASDLRRINKLYVSDANGGYTEKGKEFKFNSGAQSWITLFGDIDNDGDLDAYVVNHYLAHQLLENINNTGFKEITRQSPVLSNALNGVMRDFDNDGWLDIILTGLDKPILLHNNRDKTFTVIKNFVGLSHYNAMTVGDLNDDGFIDFYGHSFNLQNGRAQDIDELLLNNPNGNHYLKVSLKGNKSNASGIGAKLILYTPESNYMRYVQGGESYSTFHSYQQHFGLGNSALIDSLVIYWPSGQIDKFTDVNADATYYAQEGKCISRQLNIVDHPIKYYNKTIEVNAPVGYSNYKWSDGSTNGKILIDRPSTIHLTLTDVTGCQTISKPINIVNGCLSESDSLIDAQPVVLKCSKENLLISAIAGQSYIWSTGATTQSIDVANEGVYTVNIKDNCGVEFVRKVVVLYKELSFDVEGDSIQQGMQATLTSTIDNTRWFSSDPSRKLLHVGKELVTTNLETTTTFLAQGFDTKQTDTDNVGEKDFPMSNLYSGNGTNGDLLIEVYNPVFIKNLKVNTDLSGERKIIIISSEGKIVFEKIINLNVGIQTITMNASIDIAGRYRITTDENTNLNSFGFKGPRLVRTAVTTPAYPYKLGNDLSIIGTSSGNLVYYYFYDIAVDYRFLACDGDTKEVKAVVKKVVSTEEILFDNEIKVIPNPIINSFRIESKIDIKGIKIYTLDGKEIQSYNINNQDVIDISHVPNGLYIMEIASAKGNIFHKIIKTD